MNLFRNEYSSLCIDINGRMLSIPQLASTLTCFDKSHCHALMFYCKGRLR